MSVFENLLVGSIFGGCITERESYKRCSDVLKVMRRINVGLAGFVEQAEANGWELVPTISCGASPSAHKSSAADGGVTKRYPPWNC